MLQIPTVGVTGTCERALSLATPSHSGHSVIGSSTLGAAAELPKWFQRKQSLLSPKFW